MISFMILSISPHVPIRKINMSESTEFEKFKCLPYAGKIEGKRFYVRQSDDAKSIEVAKEEAKKQGFTSVFVETLKGRQLYDGPC